MDAYRPNLEVMRTKHIWSPPTSATVFVIMFAVQYAPWEAKLKGEMERKVGSKWVKWGWGNHGILRRGRVENLKGLVIGTHCSPHLKSLQLFSSGCAYGVVVITTHPTSPLVLAMSGWPAIMHKLAVSHRTIYVCCVGFQFNSLSRHCWR